MIDQNELVKVFVKEAQVFLESFEADLLELQNNINNIDSYVLSSIFRSIHSIKGACSFYKFEKIGKLSLAIEDLLTQLQYEKIELSPEIIEALSAGRTALKNMLDDIGKSEEYNIQKELSLLKKYLKTEDKPIRVINLQKKQGEGEQTKEFEISEEQLALFAKKGQSLYTIKLFLNQDLTQNGKTPFDLINTINNIGEFIESSLNFECIQGLNDCLENEISFMVLFATDIKPDMIPDKLTIPKERVTMIDMKKDDIPKDTLFLEAKTDLVASQIERLRDSFLKKLKANPNVSKVIFKADNIETVDSLGVNLIIGIYRQVTAESKTFEITGAGEKFLKVARFFQFPALFTINNEESTK